VRARPRDREQRLVQLPATIACAPSPYPRRRTTATKGTDSAAPVTSMREARRTSAVASCSGPTMKPGVSTSETIGSPKASHSVISRAALSDAAAVIAPARNFVLFAITPTGRPSIRASAVTISGA
jgi:hypothetical protein